MGAAEGAAATNARGEAMAVEENTKVSSHIFFPRDLDVIFANARARLYEQPTVL